jgi:uncharacterized tellurite resistance protein B-like protein
MAETPRLGKRAFFSIITDAVFQDGKIEPHEQEIMKQVASFLKLDSKLAQDIARRSKERFKRGELGPEVPIDGATVYEHALEVACADGTVDDEEKTLLSALRKLFRITPEFHKKTMDKVVAAQAAGLLAAIEGGEGTGKDGNYVVENTPKKSNIKKTFYLKAGGLPIPFSINLALTALAVAILILGYSLVIAVFGKTSSPDRNRRKQQTSIFDSRAERRAKERYNRYGPFGLADIGLLLVVVAASGGYWLARRQYEEKMLSDGSTITISEGLLTLPGFVKQEKKPVALQKSDIDRVYIGIHVSSRSDRDYGARDLNEGKITSLNFVLKNSARVTRFGIGSLDNVAGVTTALNDMMGVPFERVEQTVYDDYGEVMIAGGILLLGAGVVATIVK